MNNNNNNMDLEEEYVISTESGKIYPKNYKDNLENPDKYLKVEKSTKQRPINGNHHRNLSPKRIN
jgi:hypothetical protein